MPEFDVAIQARAFTWERRVFEGSGAHVELGRAARRDAGVRRRDEVMAGLGLVLRAFN